MKPKHVILAALITLFIWWQLALLPGGGAKGSLVGKSIPLFVAKNLDGSRFDVQQKLGKKILLVNFWATWCPPCRDEMPLLNRLQSEIGSEKFEILGLMEDDATDAAGFLKQLDSFSKKIPVGITVLADIDNAVAEKFGTFRLPESYLVDLSGKVLAKYEGALSERDVKKIKDQVKSLIKSEKQ